MNPSEINGVELAGRGGNYSPVTVTNNDTVGAAFLRIVAILLLITLMRSQKQNRDLRKKLEGHYE